MEARHYRILKTAGMSESFEQGRIVKQLHDNIDRGAGLDTQGKQMLHTLLDTPENKTNQGLVRARLRAQNASLHNLYAAQINDPDDPGFEPTLAAATIQAANGGVQIHPINFMMGATSLQEMQQIKYQKGDFAGLQKAFRSKKVLQKARYFNQKQLQWYDQAARTAGNKTMAISVGTPMGSGPAPAAAQAMLGGAANRRGRGRRGGPPRGGNGGGGGDLGGGDGGGGGGGAGEAAGPDLRRLNPIDSIGGDDYGNIPLSPGQQARLRGGVRGRPVQVRGGRGYRAPPTYPGRVIPGSDSTIAYDGSLESERSLRVHPGRASAPGSNSTIPYDASLESGGSSVRKPYNELSLTDFGDSLADGTEPPLGQSTPHKASSVLGVPFVHELSANDASTPHIEFHAPLTHAEFRSRGSPGDSTTARPSSRRNVIQLPGQDMTPDFLEHPDLLEKYKKLFMEEQSFSDEEHPHVRERLIDAKIKILDEHAKRDVARQLAEQTATPRTLIHNAAQALSPNVAPKPLTPRTLIHNAAQALSPNVAPKPLTPRPPDRNASDLVNSSDMMLTPVARPNPLRENVIQPLEHSSVPAEVMFHPHVLSQYQKLLEHERSLDDETHARTVQDLREHQQQIFREARLAEEAYYDHRQSLIGKLTAGAPSDNAVVDTSKLSSAAHESAVSAETQPAHVVHGKYVDDVPHDHAMTGSASHVRIVTPNPKGGLQSEPAAGSRGYMGGSNVSSSSGSTSSEASKASTPRASILKAFDGEGTTEPEEFQRIPPAELAKFHEFRAKHFYSINDLGEEKYFPGRADNVDAAKFKFRKYLQSPTPSIHSNNSSFVHGGQHEYTHTSGLDLLDRIDNDALSRSSSSIYSTYGDVDAGARALVDEYARQQELDHQIVREDYSTTPPVATSSRLFSPIGHRTPVKSAESSFRSSDFESTDHTGVSVDDVEAAAAPDYVSPGERARHFEILKNAPTHYNDDFANAIRATIEDRDLTEREVIDQVMMLHEGFKAFGGETQLQKRAREAASAAAAKPAAESEFLTDLSEPTKGSAFAQTTPASQDVNRIPDRWQPVQTPLTVSSDTVIHRPDFASLGDQTILEHNLNDDNTIVPADVFNDHFRGAFLHTSPYTRLQGLEGLRVHTRTHFQDEYLDSGDLDHYPRDLGVSRKPQREYNLRRALDENVPHRIRDMVRTLSRSPAVLAGGAYDPTADDLHAANVENADALLTNLRRNHEEVNQMHHDDQVETGHPGQLTGKYFGAHLSTKNEFSDVGGRNTFARRKFLYEKQERLAHAAEQAELEYKQANITTHSKEHISILKLRRGLYREGSQLNFEHLKRDALARRDFEADSDVPSVHAAKYRQNFPVIAAQLLQHTAIMKAAAKAAVSAAPPATHTFIGAPPPNIAKQLSVVQASAQRTAEDTRPNAHNAVDLENLSEAKLHTLVAKSRLNAEDYKVQRQDQDAKAARLRQEAEDLMTSFHRAAKAVRSPK
jgi:hypothetical protein